MSVETVSLALLGFALVFLNGFFVAAEFAIVKLRRTQADEMGKTHGMRGRVLLHIKDLVAAEVRLRDIHDLGPYLRC